MGLEAKGCTENSHITLEKKCGSKHVVSRQKQTADSPEGLKEQP